jgi:PadR family transcriptional regulator PadR
MDVDSSQMLKGILPVLVLATLAPGDTYGYAIVRRLREAGLPGIGDASVYGTLQRLADGGLVSSYLAESESGPARRYYAMTTKGRAAFKKSRGLWQSMESAVNDILAASEGAS